MAGNYLGSHKANILNSVAVPSWRNIKRGQIITATYRSATTNETYYKMYLVLHPLWPKADAKNGKMHVLDITYITPINMRNKLMKHTVQKQPLQETFRNKTFTRLDFGADPRDLYKSVVKPLVNDGFGPSYRTIIPQNLTKIRVVDYEWYDNRKEDKQGITKTQFDKQQETKQSKQTTRPEDRGNVEQSQQTKNKTLGTNEHSIYISMDKEKFMGSFVVCNSNRIFVY
jgi:hypothetical protein